MSSSTPVGGLDCRYCSVVSKAVGEDPIGSAISASYWLFIEVPRPWTKGLWEDKAYLSSLLPLFEQIQRRPRLWQQLRIGAIAPDSDPDYCRAGYTQVLYYQRPEGYFAQFDAHAYSVPTEQVTSLVSALVFEPKRLATFAPYRQLSPTRDILVCTHTHYDVACGRFGTPLYQRLRREYQGKTGGQYLSTPPPATPLRVWQTSHFGGHNFAPTLIDFPSGRFWGHLKPDVLHELVCQQGEVTRLRLFYRGWAGCDRWAQVAEREIWMQEGWPWLGYAKEACVVAKDPGRWFHRLLRWSLRRIPTIRAQVLLKKLEQKLTWAQVRIQYSHPDGGGGTYEARVEVSHRVMSQMKSGKEQSTFPVSQYRVTNLRKLENSFRD